MVNNLGIEARTILLRDRVIIDNTTKRNMRNLQVLSSYYLSVLFIDVHTGGSGRSLFKASFDGYFVRSKYEGNPRCTVFGIDNTPTILTYPPDGSRLSTFSDCTSSTDSPANEPTTSVPLETTSPSLTSSSSPPSDHTLTASVSSPPDITAVSTHTFTSSTPGLNASSTQQTEVTSLKSHATMTKEL